MRGGRGHDGRRNDDDDGGGGTCEKCVQPNINQSAFIIPPATLVYHLHAFFLSLETATPITKVRECINPSFN